VIPGNELRHALLTLGEKYTEPEAANFIQLGGGEKIVYKDFIANMAQYK